MITLGYTPEGAPVRADLARMPHLLIAGTTGSGKSTLLHSLISQLGECKSWGLLLIDPKRIEMLRWAHHPALLAPIAQDDEAALEMLAALHDEMERRYRALARIGATGWQGGERICCVVDEWALLALHPDRERRQEAMRLVARLSAAGRASGIHLVVATQRPSADVVTGLIKANFPARISLAVASARDSRVILDQVGAESLSMPGEALALLPPSRELARFRVVLPPDGEPGARRSWRGWRARQIGAWAASAVPMIAWLGALAAMWLGALIIVAQFSSLEP